MPEEGNRMSAASAEERVILGLQSAGVLMSPEEFDAIEEYDEDYHYELIHGVLVVTPIPLAEETGPNQLLGHLLFDYQQNHPQGAHLSDTLPQQYIRTSTGRRLADRVIWCGLGRMSNPRRDVPSIAVEFVSAGRRNRKRDYVDKRQDYCEAGVKEYWIIDRFQRTLTVIQNLPAGQQEQVVAEHETYQSLLLPGFVVPLARLIADADQRA
jgi:Uma2 family endonuclease